LGYLDNGDLLLATVWHDNVQSENNTSYTIVDLKPDNTVNSLDTLYTDYSVNNTAGISFNKYGMTKIAGEQYGIFTVLTKNASTNSTLQSLVAVIENQNTGIQTIAKVDNATLGVYTGNGKNWDLDNLTKLYNIEGKTNLLAGIVSNGTVNDVILLGINSGGTIGQPNSNSLCGAANLNTIKRITGNDNKYIVTKEDNGVSYIFAHNSTQTVRIPVNYTSGWDTDNLKTVAKGLYQVIDANRFFALDGSLWIYNTDLARFEEKTYNDNSVAPGTVNYYNGTNQVLELKANDNPYFNKVVFANNVNGLEINPNLLLVAGNNSQEDKLVYVNRADNTDAQYKDRVLDDKDITEVFSSGNYIYAVDQVGNLYIIENNNGDIQPLSTKYIGTIQDVVSKEDGSAIYVVSEQGFIHVVDKNGSELQSFQIEMSKELDTNLDTVDDVIYPTTVRVAYAGNYVYSLAIFTNIQSYAGNTITQKDYGYVIIYKLQDDGTLNKIPVGFVKLFETTQNAGGANAIFAKVVGSGSNANLYLAYSRAGTNVIQAFNLANPESPSQIAEQEFTNANPIFSSQAIYVYTPTTLQKYVLPNLVPSVSENIPTTGFVSSFNSTNTYMAYGYGNYFFGVDTVTNRRVAIIDASDIQNLRLAGDTDIADIGLRTSTIQAINVKAVGDKTYLYVGTPNGLVIYDLNSMTLQY
jgi:hypothetical protein